MSRAAGVDHPPRSELEIGERRIGDAHPCLVIAEAGVNHNGDPDLALRLIDLAADAGAHAVKFQTFRADLVVAPDAPKAEYQTRGTGTEASHLEMLRGLELGFEDFRALAEHCSERGILFLSTPFDAGSVDFLDELGMAAFKVSSGELTNRPLLDHIARKGRPMIISTGMATLGEVESAVRTVRRAGNDRLALLHCVSEYPARPEDANLLAMRTLRAEFGVPVGFSDHTAGIEVALAAVALGAAVIEKHFTLGRDLPGPDHRASLEPTELRRMVEGIRIVEAARGHGRKVPTEDELRMADVARRSLVAARDLAAGEVLTDSAVELRRPGTGLPPDSLPSLVGRPVTKRVPRGALLTPEMFT